MSVHLGKDCKLYRKAGGSWVEMTNVRDVTLNMETGEADVTTRAEQGWRVYLATLKEATLEFEMLVDSGDADYTAIRTAFLLGEQVAFNVGELLNYPDDRRFYGMVTGFSNSQPLEEGDSVSVTVRRKRIYL